MTGRAPFDLVVFDLDGTLVDSLPDIAGALNATLADAQLPVLAVETIATFVGDGAGNLIARAVPSAVGDPALQASLLARFMKFYADAVCVDSRLYPGIAPLLHRLAEQQVTTAVVTNKPGALARPLLQALGVAEHFAAIIGDGDGNPRKPDPTAARTLIARLGVDCSRVAVIGDGLADMGLARAIPCTGIAAGWGYVPLAQLAAAGASVLAPAIADAERLLLSPPSPS